MRERIRTLFESGATYTEIAKALGLSRNAVAGHCHRMGLKREKVAAEPKPIKPKRVKPVLPDFYSPKQREAYIDLQRAVLNTGGRRQ